MNDLGANLIHEFLLGAVLREAFFSWFRRKGGHGRGQAGS